MKKINIFSPSMNLKSVYPNHYNQAIEFLKTKNYQVEDFEYKSESKLYPSISPRIDNFHQALLSEGDYLMASIGGNNSIDLIEQLDYQLIQNTKKIIIASSDVLVILMAIYAKTQKKSIYGPMLLTHFSESPINELNYYFLDNLLHHYNYQFFPKYCEYKTSLDSTENYLFQENKWIFHQKGRYQGRVIVLNESIIPILNTKYFPQLTSRDILFIEDNQYNIMYLARMYQTLKINGVFDQVQAIVLAKYGNYQKLDCELKPSEILSLYTDKLILSDFDFGHTFPFQGIILGAEITIDCDNQTIYYTKNPLE